MRAVGEVGSVGSHEFQFLYFGVRGIAGACESFSTFDPVLVRFWFAFDPVSIRFRAAVDCWFRAAVRFRFDFGSVLRRG